MEETAQQEKPTQNSPQTRNELKELWIKKLWVEIDFSINKMVSCHISMATMTADTEKSKDGNIRNCLEK